MAHEPPAAEPAGSATSPAFAATAAPSPAPPSVRARLARLSRETALSVDGVADAVAGPVGLWVTSDRGERVPGVVASALPGGGYAVQLHLIAAMVPLRPLADIVRERIRAAAAAAGLAAQLGPIDITIEDLAGP